MYIQQEDNYGLPYFQHCALQLTLYFSTVDSNDKSGVIKCRLFFNNVNDIGNLALKEVYRKFLTFS